MNLSEFEYESYRDIRRDFMWPTTGVRGPIVECVVLVIEERGREGIRVGGFETLDMVDDSEPTTLIWRV
jgi:hypothetical protein